MDVQFVPLEHTVTIAMQNLALPVQKDKQPPRKEVTATHNAVKVT